MTGLMAAVIAHRYATLFELQTIYSYEDVLNMYEILTVRNYNEWAAAEEAKRR
jgi:hypothetical protein